MLFEFGLGTGDGGPWKARLGDALDTPEQMVRGELRWALTHGMAERVRLLVEHGVDIVSPFDDGVTPAERAATTGYPELARYLVEHGASAPDLGPGQRFVAADPDIRDQRFDSTPLGWARCFRQEQLVALLEPLTAPEEP